MNKDRVGIISLAVVDRRDGFNEIRMTFRNRTFVLATMITPALETPSCKLFVELDIQMVRELVEDWAPDAAIVMIDMDGKETKFDAYKPIAFRIAMRSTENGWWVGLLARTGTIDGAIEIGRIRRSVVEDDLTRRLFIDTMKSALVQALKDMHDVTIESWTETEPGE